MISLSKVLTWNVHPRDAEVWSKEFDPEKAREDNTIPATMEPQHNGYGLQFVLRSKTLIRSHTVGAQTVKVANKQRQRTNIPSTLWHTDLFWNQSRLQDLIIIDSMVTMIKSTVSRIESWYQRVFWKIQSVVLVCYCSYLACLATVYQRTLYIRLWLNSLSSTA
jgi:hypothetical protein